jgi:hypothetical protein
MLEPVRRWAEGRMIVAGPQYPPEVKWPPNVERVTHPPQNEHRAFYNAQRFTLNITRADMIAAGYSPSVRLFEPGREVFIARSADDTLGYLRDMTEAERQAAGGRATGPPTARPSWWAMPSRYPRQSDSRCGFLSAAFAPLRETTLCSQRRGGRREEKEVERAHPCRGSRLSRQFRGRAAPAGSSRSGWRWPPSVLPGQRASGRAG